MDFDRNAIGSLEDVRREWDSLESERAKVEEKLRSFEGAAGGRGGGGYGGRGGRGGGGRGRTTGFVGRGGGGGDWSRDRPRDSNAERNSGEAPQPKPYQISREKLRAMSGTWERGLDPATAAVEDDDDSAPQPEERRRGRGVGVRGGMRSDHNDSTVSSYQRFADKNGNRAGDGSGRDYGRAVTARPANGSGDGMRGDRDFRWGTGSGTWGGGKDSAGRAGGMNGTMRGDRNGSHRVKRDIIMRKDANHFRAGGVGRGEGSKDQESRKDEVYLSGGGGGEPDAKRPRVTSMIVVAGDGDVGNGGDGGVGTMENGEPDRWNADPAPTTEAEVPAEKTATAATEAPKQDDDDNEDENVDYEPEAEPEAAEMEVTSPAPPGEEETAASDEQQQDPMEQDEDVDGAGERRPAGKIVVVSGGGPRGRAARVGGVAGSGGIRQSLAKRLGPPMGVPVRVGASPGEGEEGGAFVPLAERPMPEPSKPELHPAYKDGDTKKRNRRMFGGLMAHLGRARKQLDHDKPLIQRQNNAVEMAAIRQQKEKRQQRQSAALAARQERDEELHKRDFINARQNKTLVALHGNAFIANQEQLKGFIFTKTLPKLAWSPNEPTDATQALLADSVTEIDARISARKEGDDQEFQRIDNSVAQRAASRASRRVGGFTGERPRGRGDRDANPDERGNDSRWPTSGAGEGEDSKGEETAQIGTRRKRGGHDGVDGNGSGEGGGAGDVGLPSDRNDDGAVGDADDKPMAATGGGGEEEVAKDGALEAANASGEGMEVDEGDAVAEGGKPETSPPARSQAPAWEQSGDDKEEGGGDAEGSSPNPEQARTTSDNEGQEGGSGVIAKEGDENGGGGVDADADPEPVGGVNPVKEDEREREEDEPEVEKRKKKKKKKDKSPSRRRKSSSRRSSGK